MKSKKAIALWFFVFCAQAHAVDRLECFIFNSKNFSDRVHSSFLVATPSQDIEFESEKRNLKVIVSNPEINQEQASVHVFISDFNGLDLVQKSQSLKRYDTINLVNSELNYEVTCTFSYVLAPQNKTEDYNLKKEIVN